MFVENYESLGCLTAPLTQLWHPASKTLEGRVGKKPGFFQKTQKTWFFWFKPGFFFQSHIHVFINENLHVLEQLITNINYYLV